MAILFGGGGTSYRRLVREVARKEGVRMQWVWLLALVLHPLDGVAVVTKDPSVKAVTEYHLRQRGVVVGQDTTGLVLRVWVEPHEVAQCPQAGSAAVLLTVSRPGGVVTYVGMDQSTFAADSTSQALTASVGRAVAALVRDYRQ